MITSVPVGAVSESIFDFFSSSSLGTRSFVELRFQPYGTGKGSGTSVGSGRPACQTFNIVRERRELRPSAAVAEAVEGGVSEWMDQRLGTFIPKISEQCSQKLTCGDRWCIYGS